jgi:hypothetical protein
MKKIHTITFQYVETGEISTMRTDNPQHYTRFAGHPAVNVVLIKASVSFVEEKPAHIEHGFRHFNWMWDID